MWLASCFLFQLGLCISSLYFYSVFFFFSADFLPCKLTTYSCSYTLPCLLSSLLAAIAQRQSRNHWKKFNLIALSVALLATFKLAYSLAGIVQRLEGVAGGGGELGYAMPCSLTSSFWSDACGAAQKRRMQWNGINQIAVKARSERQN